jgi:hypothetical protein
MNYASALGLGKRKRPVVKNDNSPAKLYGDKTTPVAAPTAPGDATSVPIITAERVVASPCPISEFSPETIGGVEMLVAESPAARGRPHVRPNALKGSGYAGRAWLGSSEGSHIKGRAVGSMAGLVWSGPKLGSRSSGNDCGCESSAGTVTTGDDSARGGGQRWAKRPKSLNSKSSSRSTE